MSIPDFKRLFRRTWLIGVAVSFILYALICHHRYEFKKLDKRFESYRENIERRAAGLEENSKKYVIKDQLMPSVWAGRQSR